MGVVLQSEIDREQTALEGPQPVTRLVTGTGASGSESGGRSFRPTGASACWLHCCPGQRRLAVQSCSFVVHLGRRSLGQRGELLQARGRALVNWSSKPGCNLVPLRGKGSRLGAAEQKALSKWDDA